jgi:hypothetical protein
MNLKRLEKIEAFVSVIEEQELLIYENNALMAYYDQLEKEKEQPLQDSEKGRYCYLLKKHIVQWKFYLMESLNAHTYNLLFYKNRLRDLLLEE